MLFTKEKKRDLSPEQGIFSSAFVCYLFPFVVFGGYLLYCILAKLMPAANSYYLLYHLYTYDKGYISRGLVGEIISWFADTVSDDLTRWVLTGFSALLMIGLALCIGKALSSVRHDREKQNIVLFLVMLFLVIPMPFGYYCTDIKFDKVVWALTLLSVFIADTKAGKWLVPFICMLATVTNPIFVFISMVLIAIILLQEFYSSGFSWKNGVICGVTYISIIVLTFLGMILERQVDFENAMEMVDYYFSRYEGTLHEYTRERFNFWLSEYFVSENYWLNIAKSEAYEGFDLGIKTFANLLIYGIPIWALSGSFWARVMKSEDNKFQKFIYFLCMISPVAMVPHLLFSWEFSRHFLNNVFVQTGLLIYFVVKGHTPVIKVCNEVKEIGKKHLFTVVVVVAYFLSLFVTIFHEGM